MHLANCRVQGESDRKKRVYTENKIAQYFEMTGRLSDVDIRKGPLT